MSQETDQLFQERVDELLLLEQRVERRAEQFLKLTRDYQQKNDRAVKDLVEKIAGVGEALTAIHQASQHVDRYVAQCIQQARHTVQLFLSVVVICVLFVAGTLWWANDVRAGLASDTAALNHFFDVTLTHKPLFKHIKGKEYVRVVPGSETTFRGEGKGIPGRYAQVWHVR